VVLQDLAALICSSANLCIESIKNWAGAAFKSGEAQQTMSMDRGYAPVSRHFQEPLFAMYQCCARCLFFEQVGSTETGRELDTENFTHPRPPALFVNLGARSVQPLSEAFLP
jgi:hypothetical protein